MAIELPQAVANYFAADQAGSAEAVSRCFTEDAIVKDEGKTHVGRDAIRQWVIHANAKYNYTAVPFALAIQDGRTLVTSRLTGDFPGSPVDLSYVFVLAADKISALEIIP